MVIPSILEKVGDTPLVSIELEEYQQLSLYTKLEAYNPTGSVKDRAASYILKTLLLKGVINKETKIIESTSGNFGVALSAFCKYYGLKFIAVIDPHITSMNEMLIRSNGAEMHKVTERDEHGGYLMTRLEKVKELKEQINNSYWINQYENPLNAAAYYHSLGKEMCFQIEQIDYVFMGVSSGGTITGVSQKIKENFPKAQIIAVDVEGSRIFGESSKQRFIPGIGSSITPKILDHAMIDDFVIVNEQATISACYELFETHNFFVGGSSGSVFAGIKKYFQDKKWDRHINVVCVFPDRGERYFDTIYKKEWCQEVLSKKNSENLMPA